MTEKRKSVLLVLFIPSTDRYGNPVALQEVWSGRALEMLGRFFGGATAYPKARGVWRDDGRGGELVYDEPIIVHCYTSGEDISNPANYEVLSAFCVEMGKDMKQGEVGLVIGDSYIGIPIPEEET